MIRFTHLTDDEKWELLKNGAFVAEVCEEDETLLQYLRPDGSVYAREELVDGERRLVVPKVIH